MVNLMQKTIFGSISILSIITTNVMAGDLANQRTGLPDFSNTLPSNRTPDLNLNDITFEWIAVGTATKHFQESLTNLINTQKQLASQIQLDKEKIDNYELWMKCCFKQPDPEPNP